MWGLIIFKAKDEAAGVTLSVVNHPNSLNFSAAPYRKDYTDNNSPTGIEIVRIALCWSTVFGLGAECP